MTALHTSLEPAQTWQIRYFRCETVLEPRDQSPRNDGRRATGDERPKAAS